MAFSRTAAPLVAGALVVLSACVTHPRGDLRTFNVNDGNVSIASDARLRMVLAREPNVESRPGLVSPYSIICAEPSPDVAAVVASSVGVGLSVRKEGTASAAAGVAEGALQLGERTASIQLMRDMMYRACESYANGAITGTNYTLLMGQITETMITLLMGETAGGAFGRSLGALGARSSADADARLAGFAGGVADIEDAVTKLADAELAVQAAAEDHAAKKAATPNDAAATTEAKNKLDRLTGERDALKTLLQGELEASSKAAGEITTVRNGGGITATPDAATAQVLGEMQRTFIQRDASQQVIQACLVELGMWNTAEGVGDILLGPTKELAAMKSSIRNYNSEDNDQLAGALLIATSRMERTGLFDFCQQYFPQLAAEVYRTNAAIRMEQATQQVRAQEVRWLEARGNAASAMATALSECERIADVAARERCKGVVLAVEGARLPDPSATMLPLRDSLLASGGQNTLPTRNFALANAAFERLKAKTAELRGLALEAVPEANSRRRGERDALDKTKQARLVSADGLIGENAAGFATDAAKKKSDDLAALERQQIDISNRLAGELDPYARRLAVADLDKARATAEKEAGTYDALAAKLDALSAELDRVVRDITLFNQD